MPTVLLFGCNRALVDRLRKDSRWEVAVAEHSDVVSPGIPDPRHWSLVVDDCANVNEVYGSTMAQLAGIPFYAVTDAYLEEMTRAHGIHFVGSDWTKTWHQRLHWHAYAKQPKGHKHLEFNPCSEVAELLADFVEEFEADFVPSHLVSWRPPEIDGVTGLHSPIPGALFRDAYGLPLLGLRRLRVPWLLSINIPDKQRRTAALEHLCYRSAPKLWPDLYAGSFQPRRVKELEAERSHVAMELRSRMAQLNEEIGDELAFYAPYLNLLVLGDDSLKGLVREAFEQVFGFSAADLDELVPEGERKTLDLRVERGAWSAFVEVRSRGNRNAQKTDVENLNDHYAEAEARHGPANSKVLVFNGMYWRDPSERARHKTFDKPTIEEAEGTGVCLVNTQQLLACIEAHRNRELTVEALVTALSRPGLLLLSS